MPDSSSVDAFLQVVVKRESDSYLKEMTLWSDGSALAYAMNDPALQPASFQVAACSSVGGRGALAGEAAFANRGRRLRSGAVGCKMR